MHKKRYNTIFKVFICEKFKKKIHYFTAFYLIERLMKSPKNIFKKLVILKT